MARFGSEPPRLDRYIDHGSDPSGRYVAIDSEDSHWATCSARDHFAHGRRP